MCHPFICWDNVDICCSYDFAAIEESLIVQNVVSDPSDVTYLVMQLRQLPKEARMYIIWALFFGTTSVPLCVNGYQLMLAQVQGDGSRSDGGLVQWQRR